MIPTDELPDRRDHGIFIYALTDPITDEVRYIGRTSNLQERYAQHCGATGWTGSKKLVAWQRTRDSHTSPNP